MTKIRLECRVMRVIDIGGKRASVVLDDLIEGFQELPIGACLVDPGIKVEVLLDGDE